MFYGGDLPRGAHICFIRFDIALLPTFGAFWLLFCLNLFLRNVSHVQFSPFSCPIFSNI